MKNDTREICLLHANCQGEPLAQLLAVSPEFAARWAIYRYTNYTREAIPDFVLKKATLFLYQAPWVGVGHCVLRCSAGLPRAYGKTNVYPQYVFWGYWPFWTKGSPMDFGDFFWDKLTPPVRASRRFCEYT